MAGHGTADRAGGFLVFTMARKTRFVRSASSAIAAVLVLGSTQAMAQPIAVPSVPTVTTPQTGPVTPAATPPAPNMISEPVVQQVPDAIVPPELPEVESAAIAAAEAAAPVAVRAPTPAAGAATQGRAQDVAPVVPTADASVRAVQPDPASAPIAATPARESVASLSAPDGDPVWSDNVGLLIGLLAALGIGALAIWSFVTIGRRKALPPVIEPPAVTQAAPVEPVTPAPQLAIPMTAQRVQPASVAHSGASIPLPRSRPDSFEQRDALLRRMVAAKPDRANPFVSPKARLRRARLILQSLDQDFGGRETWIDFSQYPGNWPSTNRTSAAA